MASTPASRARADQLSTRIALIRAEHVRATGRALMRATTPPPHSHLGALHLAEHFPEQVAAHQADPQVLAAVLSLLLLIEIEQQLAR